MKLSACLVIRNEEEVLERCLNSLKNITNEIIIIHDGNCNDKSREIAKRHRAEFIIRNFVGEAEYHRPEAFRIAKGDWILHLDADEYLSSELQAVIPELMTSRICDAYSFSWPYPGKGQIIKKGPFRRTLKPALFRKKLLYMVGISHEYPRTYGKLCKREDLIIFHQPLYDNFSAKLFRVKWIKWARIQAQQIKEIDSLPVFNIDDKKNNGVIVRQKFIFSKPVLSAFEETVKFILIYLKRGLLFAGLRSWKIAFMELSYIWLLRINILKIKHA